MRFDRQVILREHRSRRCLDVGDTRLEAPDDNNSREILEVVHTLCSWPEPARLRPKERLPEARVVVLRDRLPEILVQCRENGFCRNNENAAARGPVDFALEDREDRGSPVSPLFRMYQLAV